MLSTLRYWWYGCYIHCLETLSLHGVFIPPSDNQIWCIWMLTRNSAFFWDLRERMRLISVLKSFLYNHGAMYKTSSYLTSYPSSIRIWRQMIVFVVRWSYLSSDDRIWRQMNDHIWRQMNDHIWRQMIVFDVRWWYLTSDDGIWRQMMVFDVRLRKI